MASLAPNAIRAAPVGRRQDALRAPIGARSFFSLHTTQASFRDGPTFAGGAIHAEGLTNHTATDATSLHITTPTRTRHNHRGYLCPFPLNHACSGDSDIEFTRLRRRVNNADAGQIYLGNSTYLCGHCWGGFCNHFGCRPKPARNGDRLVAFPHNPQLLCASD